MKKIKLSEYLAKVGLDEAHLIQLSPVERLTAIYTAHILSFSYNNGKLRQAGRQHPVQRHLRLDDYKDVFFKPSGGYCFELATLLKEILITLGYVVDACEARILMGAEINSKDILQIPPSHLVLKVTLEDKTYFLDPGLGSQAPRLPILVSSGKESVVQPSDENQLYYLEKEQLYVLERRTEQGWLRLLQTDLRPLTQAKIESNLMQLEHHFRPLAIRDEKMLIGRILPQGRCSLQWFAASNQLKYVEKTEAGYKEEIVIDYERAAQIALEKFRVQITAEEIQQCCTSNIDKQGFLFFESKPKRPWSVGFPLDERALESMQSNLPDSPKRLVRTHSLSSL